MIPYRLMVSCYSFTSKSKINEHVKCHLFVWSSGKVKFFNCYNHCILNLPIYESPSTKGRLKAVIISQFTVAVWARDKDKGHCRTNVEINGDEILDTCSWKLCNHYSLMHKQCTPLTHRWKYSLERGNTGYLYSTSIIVGVKNVQSGTSLCFEDLWIFGVIAVVC